MPSPFPGMDPYLEAPNIWPDFHERFATLISMELNDLLPAPFYAQLQTRPEVGIGDEGDEEKQRRIPDITVNRPDLENGGVAVAVVAATLAAPSFHVVVPTKPFRHQFIELRDPQDNHHLITLIEIVSPSNKRSGVDRLAYLEKQEEILDSSANLVELDLLRKGKRLLANNPYLEDQVFKIQPPPDYLIMVNRSWHRIGSRMGVDIIPVGLKNSLPVIGIPLKQQYPEVQLDLQKVFNLAYEKGPYRRKFDYRIPPVPPLKEEDRAWAQILIQQVPAKAG